ncbi:hypothetical protein A2cp1_3748 [Anaeromyxobacter dehalogenans 2CP-1]|uniref:Peptidase M12A domain-containing protein n=2 Tax=Anaeromyxobacter dehalogenans TaxID=161493 RepID=B8J6V2_ANAD2|nr:hypothetical protein A2cp1_3748 [Anaeromyxobacter dehalogenans 2CP-1]
MYVNFTFQNWSPSCAAGSMRRYCIEAIGVHEFGHALGFSHEQNRPDTPRDICTDAPQGTNGDTLVGAWDLESVMNYCNPNWNNGGVLSATDIFGLRIFYGPPNQLSREAWARASGGFWNAQKWLAGDFNGDGRADLANVFNDGGYSTVDVHLSTGNGFVQTIWATRSGGFWDAQKWLAGDFNGDGRTDLANVFYDGGYSTVDVHVSTGSGFVRTRWATRSGAFWDAQKWLAGDFNGDGRTDLANVFNDGGYSTVDVHVSTGSAFVRRVWATRSGDFWDAQKWLAGDFDGDGRADLANVFNDGGLMSADVHVSTGISFERQAWVRRSYQFWDAQKWMAADLSGDGRADLVNVFSDGDLMSADVNVSSGAGFRRERWATRSYGFSDAQKWMAADFSGDGRADLANVFNDAGNMSSDIHVAECPSGWQQCSTASGSCVDMQHDAANCGSCANTCASGLTCNHGSCG